MQELVALLDQHGAARRPAAGPAVPRPRLAGQGHRMGRQEPPERRQPHHPLLHPLRHRSLVRAIPGRRHAQGRVLLVPGAQAGAPVPQVPDQEIRHPSRRRAGLWRAVADPVAHGAETGRADGLRLVCQRHQAGLMACLRAPNPSNHSGRGPWSRRRRRTGR
ncbi:hypothetical protein MTBUT4_40086 [Magnetospirillum sp. UT-4]|nr:hypothetical protein MTBUT4_40086 [Magnetospirillum sp. UT-4]